MIGLDTNVLVRYIMQDDPLQASLANNVIDNLSSDDKGFLSYVVLVELVWVLMGAYKCSKTEITKILHLISRTDVFEIEKPQILAQAIKVYEKASADFVDCLIERCAYWGQCSKTYTFDKKASLLANMMLLENKPTNQTPKKE